MTMVALWVTFSSITVFLSSFLTTFKSSVVMAAMAAETEAATDSAAEALVSAPLSRLRFLPADDDVVLVVFLPERRALVDAAAPPFFLPPPLDLAGFFDPLDLVAVVFFLVLAAPVVLAAAFLAGRALAAAGGALAPFFLVGAMVAVLSLATLLCLDVDGRPNGRKNEKMTACVPPRRTRKIHLQFTCESRTSRKQKWQLGFCGALIGITHHLGSDTRPQGGHRYWYAGIYGSDVGQRHSSVRRRQRPSSVRQRQRRRRHREDGRCQQCWPSVVVPDGAANAQSQGPGS